MSIIVCNVAPQISAEEALELAYHDAAATLKLINEARRSGLPKMNSNQTETLLHVQRTIRRTLSQIRIALR